MEDVVLGRDYRLPYGVRLIFNGGIIKGNHVLEGNQTYIDAPAAQIFDDELDIRGTWTSQDAYCEWFGGGVNVDDNTRPIQKCLDGFNQLTLLPGIYHISRTISVNHDGCLIQGVSCSKSEIRKSPNAPQQINAVIHLNSTRSKNIQHVTIRDLKISAAAFNVDYGIYTNGVNSSEFRNLTIFQCKNGFYCNNESHGALWNLIFDNIEFNCNTLRIYEGMNHYGYKEGESCGVTCVTNGGASVQFNKCWSRDCATGFHLKGLGYSQLNMCAADNIHGAAYIIEYCRLAMNECGMENIITSTAVHLYQSQATVTGFNDYQMIAYEPKETYRIKVDGGSAVFINCNFSEWKKQSSRATIYGITANYSARIIMNNTVQPRNVVRKYDAINGSSIKYIE